MSAETEPFPNRPRIKNHGCRPGGRWTKDAIVGRMLLVLTLSLTVLTGCERKPDTVVAEATGPAFDPIVFFGGHTRSWGVLENRSGAPSQWITTDGRGQIETGGVVRMVQHLSFQDGSAQQRDWILWRDGAGQYEATANDMIGTARGQVTGGIFHWQWVLARSGNNALMNVTMDQWMYPMPDGSAMIRTTVGKFGIVLAQVTERFVRD